MENFNAIIESLWAYISENKVFALAIIIIIMTTLYKRFFSKNAIAKQKFKDSKTKQIFNFKDGEIGKVTGTVKNIYDPHISPITNKKCVYYKVIVYHEPGDNKNKIIEEEKISDFVLENNSGKVLVKLYPNDANCIYEINLDTSITSDLFKNVTPGMKKFLEKYKIEAKNFIGLNKNFEFVIRSIEVGEKIGVYGKGLRELPVKKYSDVKTKWHETEILTFKSLENQNLFISDNPKTLKRKRIV